LPEPAFFFNTAEPPPREECPVFLPGWGFDGRVTLLPDSPRPWLTTTASLPPEQTIAELVAYLDRNKIHSVILAGWSLGAYLALDFALAGPGLAKALYLLSARKSWPPEEINGIRADLHADPIAFMQSFYRKCFLGYRDNYRKFTAQFEPSYLDTLDLKVLDDGLDFLENYQLEEKLARLADTGLPVYLLHGGQDIIAPAAEAVACQPAASRIIKTAGHPLFLDESCPLDWHHKKDSIRRKFSRSADTYDRHATVQVEVAEKLVKMLPAEPPASILETGCGTGNYTRLLNERYSGARITAIDFAEGMLAQARQKLIGNPAIDFLCADAEDFLQTTSSNFELITSNATMHWFDNLENTTRLIGERLAGAGQLVCSIFGPQTMQEMRAALNKLHDKKMPMPSDYFPDRDSLQKILSSTFSEIEISEWQISRSYPSVAALLKHISKTGTSGWHPGRPLINRQQLEEVERLFNEAYGECRCTYQVFLVSCRK